MKGLEDFHNTFLAIGMPALNEEKNIEHVVTEALNVLKRITKKYEVIVVDDGSTDRTGRILDRMAVHNPHLRVFHHKRRRGIGQANRLIYKKVRAKILFWNASDNQIHMDELYTLLPHIRVADIVVGHRVHRADHWSRKVVSQLFNYALRWRYGLRIRDVDSVKVFRTTIFSSLVLHSKNAYVETEILVKAKAKKFRVVEVPIKHYPRLKGKPSGVSLKIVVPQLWDFTKQFFGLL